MNIFLIASVIIFITIALIFKFTYLSSSNSFIGDLGNDTFCFCLSISCCLSYFLVEHDFNFYLMLNFTMNITYFFIFFTFVQRPSIELKYKYIMSIIISMLLMLNFYNSFSAYEDLNEDVYHNIVHLILGKNPIIGYAFYGGVILTTIILNMKAITYPWYKLFVNISMAMPVVYITKPSQQTFMVLVISNIILAVVCLINFIVARVQMLEMRKKVEKSGK